MRRLYSKLLKKTQTVLSGVKDYSVAGFSFTFYTEKIIRRSNLNENLVQIIHIYYIENDDNKILQNYILEHSIEIHNHNNILIKLISNFTYCYKNNKLDTFINNNENIITTHSDVLLLWGVLLLSLYDKNIIKQQYDINYIMQCISKNIDYDKLYEVDLNIIEQLMYDKITDIVIYVNHNDIINNNEFDILRDKINIYWSAAFSSIVWNENKTSNSIPFFY